tara:strand:+ start:513 stop:1526 length:1014 start_codon:yes stop_codon:yes gene_type:complete
MENCDIIVGLQYGDEGKGKVVYNLIQKKNYDYCVRFNGGPNAGHTIYHNGKKLITRQIPTGIFYGLTCIIGSNCVLDLNKLEEEIKLVDSVGINDIRQKLKIANNCHIINEEYIIEDKKTDKVGSTGSGIRPAYREKYNRRGIRADTFEDILGCEIIDSYQVLSKEGIKILCEGAQGFMLDIDYGKYPYVTSSNCHAGIVTNNGLSIRNIRNVYGICKCYNTYVGNMEYQPVGEEGNIMEELGRLGHEFGSNTERKRQCNWLDIDELIKAIYINGVNVLIMNKCDIIEKLGIYKLYHKNKLIEFENFNKMKEYIINNIKSVIRFNIEFIFSFNKDTI